MIKLVLKLVVVVLALVAAYFCLTFLQVWEAARRDEARPAQAIVVFGAAQYDGRPSAVLKARLDHAGALWKRKLAPWVVVTGGKQPGDRFTEASASARYLATLGLPDRAVLREVQGRNSWDSLAAGARVLRQRGITDVLLVSDPFHSVRIAAMANELGLRAHTSPTRTSPIKGTSELRWMARETVAVGLGRLVGYRRLLGGRSGASGGDRNVTSATRMEGVGASAPSQGGRQSE